VQSAKAQYSVKQVIESSPAQMQIEAIELALQWFPIWLSANKRGEAPLLHYLTGQYLGEMRDRFGVDNKAADEVSGKAKFVSADGEEYVFLYEKGVPHFNAR